MKPLITETNAVPAAAEREPVTSQPARVQRTRPRVKGQPGMPAGAVYVGRGTRWGNPFKVVPLAGGRFQVIDTGDRSCSLREEPQITTEAYYGRVMATRLFELHTTPMGLYAYTAADLADARRLLGGRDLACWCPLPEPGETDFCHAAHLLTIANETLETV
ncbi:DUF4326 domain-containing protein [Streptomyces antimycoticus]